MTAPAPAPPAPAPAPTASPDGPQPGVPLSLTLSAAPPAPGATSTISKFTNTTRGALSESRNINNQELVKLLRSTQDNGGSTSTLLFVSLSSTQLGDAPPDDGDGDAAGALTVVPVKHRAGRGDYAPPGGSPIFADPAGAATGTDPSAGATVSRPAASTMTISLRACRCRGPGTPPRH